MGIVLIAYGVVVVVSGEGYALLDSIANWVALVVTLTSVLISAVSVYFPPTLRPPDTSSLWVTAPLIVIGVVVALLYSVYTRQLLPPHIVNGFALLGISGALLRLLSR